MTRFLIWSIEHDAWWRPGRAGYTERLTLAGRYDEPEAYAILAQANFPPGRVNECLIPVACVQPVPSITCPFCGRVSYNLHDIAERYCGACHRFHDDVDDDRLIVAEISKSWIRGEEVTPGSGLLAQQFERVLLRNAERGYRLLEFRMHRQMTAPDELNETIIAVFERLEPGGGDGA